MSYQVSILPASTNTDKPGLQKSILDYLREKYPYANFTKSSSGLWTVKIPDAPVIVVPPPLPQPSTPLFLDAFNYPDGLITNEYAFWNPADSHSIKSSLWEMTSGSLFCKSGMAWSGIPDDRNPDSQSVGGNDSAIFRLNSKRFDFKDVAVSFKLQLNGFVSTPSTPAVAWDGIHIFLRYQSEYQLYYASINRRDGTCVIKKKVPGGPSNGGTYYELTSYVAHAIPMGQIQNVKATVINNPDGSVSIGLYANDVLIVQGKDNGVGGPSIVNAGATGIRGDNANFMFDDFTVAAI